ncbi:MAG: branched-chain amino acid ABC transporter permease [Rhodobacteraceae bacterium]|nr:branched-chain amino acid ABC transporter permease [Paracoccaceae bacterium]
MRRFELAALCLALPAAFAAAWGIDPGLQFLLVEALVLFLMAQMWNLAAGYAGQVSFGQQLFVGAGAYALFAIANATAIPVWGVLAVVPVLVGLAAIPLGMVMFHLKHAYFAIGMWVVAEIAQQLVLITPALGGTGGLTLRPNGEPMQGFPEQVVLGLAVFGSVALVVGLRVFLRTPMGLATLAMRDNPAAAEGAGVDIRRLHLILFALTAAGTALAGAMYYTTTLYTSPLDAFQVNWIVATMFIVVIGGIGTLTGPAIGTVLMITLREVMTAYGFSGDQYWIVMGLISIVTLLFLPRGLWPALQAVLSRPRATT